jgi:uncharacterized protein YqgV (UPF0045/DUF77 family)
MITSIEISYYPLQESYIPEVQKFIDRLNTHPGIEVTTNGMSTQLFGEYRNLMQIITDEIELAFELPNSIFVIKVANEQLDEYVRYDG